MAPPSKLTPETQAAIVASIEAGNYRVTAAAAAGVHRNRLAEWEKRGESGEEPYASFACALQKAEAKAEMGALAKIRGAQSGTPGVSGADVWTNEAWFLERRFATRWCARVKQQVAENVDALLSKLKSDPDLHRKVVDVLTAEEPSAAGAVSPQH